MEFFDVLNAISAKYMTSSNRLCVGDSKNPEMRRRSKNLEFIFKNSTQVLIKIHEIEIYLRTVCYGVTSEILK